MLNTFKVSQRLAAVIALPIIALIFLCYVAYTDMRHLSTGVQDLFSNRTQPLEQIKLVSDAYAVTIVDTLHKHRGGLLTPADTIAAITIAEKTAKSEWEKYLSHPLSPAESALSDKAQKLIGLWTSEIQWYREQLEQNKVRGMDGKAFNERLYGVADPLSSSLAEIINFQLLESQKFTESATSTGEASITWFVSISTAVSLLLIVAIAMIRRSIIQPLSTLRATLVSINTQSDLSLRSDIVGTDEIADTATAFNQLIGRIQQVVDNIQNTACELAASSEQMKNVSS